MCVDVKCKWLCWVYKLEVVVVGIQNGSGRVEKEKRLLNIQCLGWES